MSDHVYEARKMNLWFEYKDLGGSLDFETFYARDLKASQYIVRIFRALGPVADADLCSAQIGEPEFNYDDPADAYAHPQGGI